MSVSSIASGRGSPGNVRFSCKGAIAEVHRWALLQPDETGLSMARALDALGVPVTMVLDSGAAYIMDRCAHAQAAAPRCYPRCPRYLSAGLNALSGYEGEPPKFRSPAIAWCCIQRFDDLMLLQPCVAKLLRGSSEAGELILSGHHDIYIQIGSGMR